ncbi:MAG: hypothetical protein HRF43_13110, partial [Phycisphaerae bacterium]
MQVFDPSAEVLCGVARREVTPPVGIYNRSWGAARHDTAEGVHRPLYATAIAMRARGPANDPPGNDDAPLVLVDLDAGWWQVPDDERYVRGAVLARFNLDEARLMIALTHTHAGPSLARADADKPGGGLIAGYLVVLRERIMEAVVEALAGAVPATLSWTYGRCGL